MSKDTSAIDEIIVGRVIPHIYAFTTNTIPNYLKVGDTYRTVESRLKEWEKYFPDLNKEYEKEALLDKTSYFRDYSVHKFLENIKGRLRLQPKDVPNGIYYSNEFFKDALKTDLDEAIQDITDAFNNKSNNYEFYDILKRQIVSLHYERNQSFCLRPNQQKVVDNFEKAKRKGRTNLLMYAVMRFGKSFTSMCCAVKSKAKLVVVVSGKADVEAEWKYTVESHVYFHEYVFITSKELSRDPSSISNAFKKHKKVVAFLTLQDLCGDKIKEKHQEIFTREIDLLLVDETHFGARADEFGKVLKEDDIKIKEYEDVVGLQEAEETYKYLNRRITIHLSGTPYRLLMGSEFTKDDIICFCQFTDIVKEQENWDKKWLLKDIYDDNSCNQFGKRVGEKVHEWDNPYYGFPQMIRFAFNPNESTQKKLNELQESGVSFAFSKLLRPESIKKDPEGKHKLFVYENEVLDLLKCIDGSKEDDNIFPFLNYDKIREGNMCRHMVVVLPYCASCDALEEIIIKHKAEFNRLSEYEIVNISGVDNINKYKKTLDVVKKIQDCESINQKTITLTVQRMLTGSTVKEWDTMIFLKDTSSPQDYDQAIFRIQNQYVETREDDKTGDVIKINLKPQTLLVDFSPNRMFYMQEKKAQIYNANIDDSGNKKLRERINYELSISPIIVLNKNRLVEVEETDILEAISNYNYDRGISEETKEISIDLSILDNKLIKNLIDGENEIDSKGGLETKANKGEGGDLDLGDQPQESGESNNNTNNSNEESREENEQAKLIRRIQNYYRRILLFSFLTKDKVDSLDDIIFVIDKKDNSRIAKNLGLAKSILKELRKSFNNKFALSSLDYKIQNLNNLSFSSKVSKDDNVSLALRKFGKLGEAIVVTPANICDDVINQFSDDDIKEIISSKKKILDISSVSGEFAFALSKRLIASGYNISDLSAILISVPKNSVCYELTRRVYEMVGFDINCILQKTNSFDLLDLYDTRNDDSIEAIKELIINELKKNKAKEIKKMKFGAIVGNPPYNEIVEKDVSNSTASKQLFPFFIEICTKLSSRYVSLITPSRWFVGGEQAGYFPKLRKFLRNNNHVKQLVHYPNFKEVFPDIDLPGGVNYFLYDKKYDGSKDGTTFVISINGKEDKTTRPLFEEGVDIVFADPIRYNIMKRVYQNDFKPLNTMIGEWNSFGVVGNRTVLDRITNTIRSEDSIVVRCAHEEIRYLDDETQVLKNKDIMNSWKVFTSKGNGGAGTLQDGKPVFIIGKSYLAEPRSICTDSLIPVGKFDNREEAEALLKYMKTKFLRFMVGILKVSQNIYQNVYKFVPVQNFKNDSDIDWQQDIHSIDEMLYKKYSLSQDEIDYVEKIIRPMN